MGFFFSLRRQEFYEEAAKDQERAKARYKWD